MLNKKNVTFRLSVLCASLLYLAIPTMAHETIISNCNEVAETATLSNLVPAEKEMIEAKSAIEETGIDYCYLPTKVSDLMAQADYLNMVEVYRERYAPKTKEVNTVVMSSANQTKENSDVYVEDNDDTTSDETSEENNVTEEPDKAEVTTYSGGHLTPASGVYNGPSGKETYYNLDMSGVISIMRSMGYSEDEYPYWERDDGCKMFGDYIMVAAELSSRPKGTIIECSLGTAMVVDTGGFAANNPTQLDIATNW